MKVYPSDGGVMGGLSTDGRARVLRPTETVINGLYACGTAARLGLWHGYPCRGALGDHFIWGNIAARILRRRRGYFPFIIRIGELSMFDSAGAPPS